MPSVTSADAPGNSTIPTFYHADTEQDTAIEAIEDRRDSTTEGAVASKYKDDIIPTASHGHSIPDQPSQITILYNHSLQPITLPTHLLTATS